MPRRNRHPTTGRFTTPARTTVGRSAEDGLALLVGAGIGMGLMYLFDPQRGPERRQRIGTGARRAFDQTSGVVGDAVSSALDAANEMTQGAGAKLSSLENGAREYSSDAADDVIARKRDWVNRASLAIGRDRDHHYVSNSMCALGSMALGAGALWLFDPQVGESRRAWLRDKAMHCACETTEFFRRVGRYAADRIRGGDSDVDPDAPPLAEPTSMASDTTDATRPLT